MFIRHAFHVCLFKLSCSVYIYCRFPNCVAFRHRTHLHLLDLRYIVNYLCKDRKIKSCPLVTIYWWPPSPEKSVHWTFHCWPHCILHCYFRWLFHNFKSLQLMVGKWWRWKPLSLAFSFLSWSSHSGTILKGRVYTEQYFIQLASQKYLLLVATNFYEIFYKKTMCKMLYVPRSFGK